MNNYCEYNNQHMYSNYTMYTTGVRAKDKMTKCLLIDIMNKTSCFQEVCIKLIDHSTGTPILLSHESIPVDRCRDMMLKLQLEDVYYGNAMNITLYEIQFCLPNAQCIYISIFELDAQQQVIPTQTLTTANLLAVNC